MNALIEKQALKELVDTFSNLADEKKVAEQMPLFTADAVVNTYIGGELVFAMTGRSEIEKVFSTFLAPFHTVYLYNQRRPNYRTCRQYRAQCGHRRGTAQRHSAADGVLQRRVVHR